VPSFGNEGGDVGMAQASGFRSLRVRVLTYSVWGTQGCIVPSRKVGGIGVRSFTSSLESTLSRLYGTRPAPIKLACIFFSVVVAKKALQKV
jgi:hypothetical protein